MKTLHRLIRLLMVIGGCVGAVACTWVLVDPSIASGSNPMGLFQQGSPRWRAGFGLVLSIALVLFGSGRLRHRELP